MISITVWTRRRENLSAAATAGQQMEARTKPKDTLRSHRSSASRRDPGGDCLPRPKHMARRKKSFNAGTQTHQHTHTHTKKMRPKPHAASDIKSVLGTTVCPSPRTPRGLCERGCYWSQMAPILSIQLRQWSSSQGGVTVGR